MRQGSEVASLDHRIHMAACQLWYGLWVQLWGWLHSDHSRDCRRSRSQDRKPGLGSGLGSTFRVLRGCTSDSRVILSLINHYNDSGDLWQCTGWSPRLRFL